MEVSETPGLGGIEDGPPVQSENAFLQFRFLLVRALERF